MLAREDFGMHNQMSGIPQGLKRYSYCLNPTSLEKIGFYNEKKSRIAWR